MIAARLLWRDDINWYHGAAVTLARTHCQPWRHCRVLARVSIAALVKE